MRLLFDENVSPRLVAGLSDVFPESVHVRDAGLSRATDAEIWDYARDHGLTIVSKDSDFHQAQLPQGLASEGHLDSAGKLYYDDIEELLRSNLTASGLAS